MLDTRCDTLQAIEVFPVELYQHSKEGRDVAVPDSVMIRGVEIWPGRGRSGWWRIVELQRRFMEALGVQLNISPEKGLNKRGYRLGAVRQLGKIVSVEGCSDTEEDLWW
jgi:hypothetical protein